MPYEAMTAQSERRLVLLLPLSFGLTILSFIAATIWAEVRARQIEDLAYDIYEIQVPAARHLARAQVELRHMEVLIDDYVDGRARHQRVPSARDDFERARGAFEREWARFSAIQPSPLNDNVQTDLVRLKTELNVSLDEVLEELQNNRPAAAQNILNAEAKPAINRTTTRLRTAGGSIAERITDLAREISDSVARSRSLAFVLDAISALLAALAAYLLIRTTRKHLDLLKHRMTELDHFAGRVAHDIRSPLSSVALTLDIAKSGLLDQEKTESMLARAGRTVQRVGQLIDGMLLFARAGVTPAAEAHADVKKVLEGVLEEMTPPAAQNQVELQVERVDPGAVACSEGVLISLLSNLIGNAIKYMGDAAVRKVIVRVLARERVIRVEVQDTGPGVPSELRQQIFEPHVRATSSTTPGLGLGLAMVRRLSEAHGGAAGLSPSTPGSLFWFELPKARDLTESAGAEERHSAGEQRKWASGASSP